MTKETKAKADACEKSIEDLEQHIEKIGQIIESESWWFEFMKPEVVDNRSSYFGRKPGEVLRKEYLTDKAINDFIGEYLSLCNVQLIKLQGELEAL
jgi:hypothetical protein